MLMLSERSLHQVIQQDKVVLVAIIPHIANQACPKLVSLKINPRKSLLKGWVPSLIDIES